MHNGLGHGKCLVPSPISAALKSVIFLHPFSPLYASGNKDSDKEVCKKGHLSFSLRSPAGPSHAHRKGKGGVKYRQHCSFCPAAPLLSPNVEGEVPSAHVPCDQNIRLDPQYTAKSVICTKTRVEGTREEEGQWEMGKGEERAADNDRGRLGGRADLRTANFHGGRQLRANVLCFSALGHGKVIQFHRTC